MFFFNPLYLLLIIPGLIAWYAQARVREVYRKYALQPNRLGISGEEAAIYLLQAVGLRHVRLQRTPGYLTDHYSPDANILRLSDGVARGRSLTSLGIVAHEVGHAIQDAQGHWLMRVRDVLAQWLGQMAQWSGLLFLGGMVLGSPLLMIATGIFMAGLVVFTLLTLPLERNASRLALELLARTGLADAEENEAIREVLRSAAFTYVAALGQRLGTFLFFVVLIVAAQRLWLQM